MESNKVKGTALFPSCVVGSISTVGEEIVKFVAISTARVVWAAYACLGCSFTNSVKSIVGELEEALFSTIPVLSVPY